MTDERLAELKALGSIASGIAVPELVAEIERLRCILVHLGALSDEIIDTMRLFYMEKTDGH